MTWRPSLLPAVPILALLIAIAAVVAGACVSESTVERGVVDEFGSAVVVTADELTAAYDANPIAADLDYEGKVLQVTGVVEEIGEDLLGTKYVRLAGGFWGVRCAFSDDHTYRLAALAQGQRITVIGRHDNSRFGVELRGCRFPLDLPTPSGLVGPQPVDSAASNR